MILGLFCTSCVECNETPHGALLIECRALLIQYRALLIECRALLIE